MTSPPPTRRKRPELARSEPIRRWSGLFGPETEPRAPDAEATPTAGEEAAADAQQAAAPRPEGVARGVELGYRVIEEYLQQGQAFARAAFGPSRAEQLELADPARFTERVVQHASDLAAAWVDYLQATLGVAARSAQAPRAAHADGPTGEAGAFDIEQAAEPGKGAAGAPGVGRATRGQAAGDARAERAEQGGGHASDRQAALDLDGDRNRDPSRSRNHDGDRVRSPSPRPSPNPDTVSHAPNPDAPLVSLAIKSAQLVEVTVELRPGPLPGALSAHELRAADPALPRIAGIRLASHAAEHRVTVSLDVPAEQPGGTYSGLIVDDATNLPRGMLCVRVLPEPAA